MSGLGNRAYLNLCTRLFRLSQFQNGLTTINKTMKIIVIVGTSFAIRYVLEEYLLSSFINFFVFYLATHENLTFLGLRQT